MENQDMNKFAHCKIHLSTLARSLYSLAKILWDFFLLVVSAGGTHGIAKLCVTAYWNGKYKMGR